MPHDVIMPALGMAQETGLIVAWLKKPGDAVRAGDALMEVETDKATMEVEAAFDGFLTGVRAAEGESVPVGDVVALISDSAEDATPAPDQDAAGPKSSGPNDNGDDIGETDTGSRGPSRTEARPATAPASKETGRHEGPRDDTRTTATTPKVGSSSGAIALHGRVLASPKARRLAEERGLDLGHLVEAGFEPPFHVRDLETLTALPARAAASTAGIPMSRIEADIPAAGLTGFCDWAAAEGFSVAPARAVAAFATRALRLAREIDGACHVEIARPGHPSVVHADLDRQPFGAEGAPAEAAPDLIVRDLTGTRLTSLTLGGVGAPVLTIASRMDTFALTFEFDAGDLRTNAAIALVSTVAAQIEEPLRHLL